MRLPELLMSCAVRVAAVSCRYVFLFKGNCKTQSAGTQKTANGHRVDGRNLGQANSIESMAFVVLKACCLFVRTLQQRGCGKQELIPKGTQVRLAVRIQFGHVVLVRN